MNIDIINYTGPSLALRRRAKLQLRAVKLELNGRIRALEQGVTRLGQYVARFKNFDNTQWRELIRDQERYDELKAWLEAEGPAIKELSRELQASATLN